MSKNRRNFTAQQKADIVRRHLKDKVPVSTLAEELSIQPTQIYQWVAMALEQVDRTFEKADRGTKASKRSEAKIADLKEQQIKRLQEKLVHKNEVIAELMEENVKAKKANGDL
jgi:transposase-like protein